MLKQKTTTVDTEFCSQELTAAETNGSYKNRGRIMYYKDHSADWWRLCGKMIYFGSIAASAVIAVLLLMPLYVYDLGNYFIIIAIAAVCAQGLQIYAQCYGTMCMLNAKLAANNTGNTDLRVRYRYKAMALWTSFADLLIFMIAYGIGFGTSKMYLIVGLPVMFAVLVTVLVFAVIYTQKAKDRGRNDVL